MYIYAVGNANIIYKRMNVNKLFYSAYNDSSNRSAHERKKHGKLFTAVAKEDENNLQEMVNSSCM